MSDEPKISSELKDEVLADDFVDFLTRGLAAQRAVDAAVAASACAERWYDELSCSSADGVHRCREHGAHRTHRCIGCDAMVIEDRP